MRRRRLGATGLEVSLLGFGSFKIGRNEQVKYPEGPGYPLPGDREVLELLDGASALGINLVDTAPAYGTAEERLGNLLGPRRGNFVLVTKAGEEFRDGRSSYDFSARAVEESVARSLRRLRTDRLECVLLHCPKEDLEVLEESPAAETLERLKRKGDILSHGASVHTVEGGMAAVRRMDVVMATFNLEETGMLPVLEAARRAGKGVLVKKGLRSGRLAPADFARNFAQVLGAPAVASLVVGTLRLEHLRENARWAEGGVRAAP
jgi:aryl-alcohol dehydrogenase-like predicted oxidoreductase